MKEEIEIRQPEQTELERLEEIETELRGLLQHVRGPMCRLPGQMKRGIVNALDKRRADVITKIEFQNEGLTTSEKLEATRKKLKVAGIFPNADSTIKTDARRSFCDLYCDKGAKCARNVGFFVQNGAGGGCKLLSETEN